MKKRALCPLSGVHLTIKPNYYPVAEILKVKSISLYFFYFLLVSLKKINYICQTSNH